MTRMNKRKWLILGIVSGLLVFFPVQSFATSTDGDRTDVGIQFTGEKETSTTASSSEKVTEPSIPEQPTSKPTGRLPMTGELMQPIMFLLLGWLIVALITVALFGKKKNKAENEEIQ